MLFGRHVLSGEDLIEYLADARISGTHDPSNAGLILPAEDGIIGNFTSPNVNYWLVHNTQQNAYLHALGPPIPKNSAKDTFLGRLPLGHTAFRLMWHKGSANTDGQYGHCIAVRKHQGQWYAMDSEGGSPKQLDERGWAELKGTMQVLHKGDWQARSFAGITLQIDQRVKARGHVPLQPSSITLAARSPKDNYLGEPFKTANHTQKRRVISGDKMNAPPKVSAREELAATPMEVDGPEHDDPKQQGTAHPSPMKICGETPDTNSSDPMEVEPPVIPLLDTDWARRNPDAKQTRRRHGKRTTVASTIATTPPPAMKQIFKQHAKAPRRGHQATLAMRRCLREFCNAMPRPDASDRPTANTAAANTAPQSAPAITELPATAAHPDQPPHSTPTPETASPAPATRAEPRAASQTQQQYTQFQDLRILTWNVMGLTTLEDEVATLVEDQKPQIVILTETKLVRDEKIPKWIRGMFPDYTLECSSAPAAMDLSNPGKTSEGACGETGISRCAHCSSQVPVSPGFIPSYQKP